MSTPLQLGIIGCPLGHSLSPLLHAELLKTTELTGEYKPYELKPEDLGAGLDRLQAAGINGLNVTIPHKVSVMPLLDWIHPEARLTGAVNTIVFDAQGKRNGHNTDLIGFTRSLPDAVTARLPESNVLVLGAGGSARAVLSALIQLNTAEITFAVRSPESAIPIMNLADEIRKFHQVETNIRLLALHELPSLCSVQGVVNTTPVGMWPQVKESPLSAVQLEALPAGAFVYDLVYKPLETQLLTDAKTLGYSVFNGLDMLIHQGIAAFELWTDRTVPQSVLPYLRGVLAQAVLHPIQ